MPIVNFLLFALFTFSTINLSAKEKLKVFRNQFKVENIGNRIEKDVGVCFYVPNEKSAFYELKNIKSSHKYKVIKDDCGNKVLEVKLAAIAPHAYELVTVNSLLNYEVGEKRKQTHDSLLKYLNASPFIESDNIELPSDLKFLETKEDKRLKAKAVYDWIRKNIDRSKHEGKDLGALWALKQKSGDCSEQAYLFVALCRKLKVPSRFLEGYFVEGESFHNWAEFWDGEKWCLADPHGGFFEKKHNQYLPMKILNESMPKLMKDMHRFKVIKGNVKMMMINR